MALGTKSLRPLTSRNKPNAVARETFPETGTASRSSGRMASRLGEDIPMRKLTRSELPDNDARFHAELRYSGGVTMDRKGKKSKGKAAGGERYDVMLTGGGDQRLAVARVFNEISGMKRVGAELQEIFSRPTSIKEGVTKDEAAQIKRRIEDAGGSVKITPARG